MRFYEETIQVSDQVHFNPRYQRLCQGALLALIGVQLLHQVIFGWDGLRLLYTLPLFLPLKGIWRGDNYTFQWTSMLILFYFMIGVVDMTSSPFLASRYNASVETVLSLIIFVAAILYVRPAKQAYKQRKKNGR